MLSKDLSYCCYVSVNNILRPTACNLREAVADSDGSGAPLKDSFKMEESKLQNRDKEMTKGKVKNEGEAHEVEMMV